MVQNLLIQASLSDIEAVVRKVLDDRLNDLIPQRKEDTPLYLTRDEAAKMLRITLPTLNDWTKLGRIPVQRIGRRVLYALSDIENAETRICGG